MIEFAVGGPLESESGEVLGVPVFSDRRWGPGANWAVEQLGDWVAAYLDEHDFRGRVGEVVLVPTAGRLSFRTVAFVGLGDEVDLEGIRRAGGTLGRKTTQVADVATTLHGLAIDGAAQAVTEGFILGQYRFDKYQTEPKPSRTERLRFVGSEVDLQSAQKGAIIADAVWLARDLCNEPAGAKSPETLADLISEMGSTLGMRVKIYDEHDIKEERFGALAGVAQGAHNPARMVEIWYEPDDAKAFVALVGKGIVFDSGGLSLKPAAAMENMKSDMSGAAAVFGAVQAIATLGLPVKVLGITPLTENMPGGGAIRPGDVVRARNGKTIEILNTDAEGRLVLADALSLAVEAEPEIIVDLATLTGACHVALGDKIAGLWSNDQSTSEKVTAAGAAVGERIWPMPLPDDYRKNIDSDIADMKNTGGRYGGAINAALLLKEFVGDVPWVHLDVAGPARWPDDEHYQSKGGSGFGVRTLVSLAEGLAVDR